MMGPVKYPYMYQPEPPFKNGTHQEKIYRVVYSPSHQSPLMSQEDGNFALFMAKNQPGWHLIQDKG